MSRRFHSIAAAFAWLALLAGPVAGQPAALQLELNAAQPSDKGCRLTFVVTNGLGKSLDRAAFEMALFNEQGVVDRLSVLEFKDLPAGKTKVSRFELPGTDCGKISRVLINTTTACEGVGVEPKACGEGLSLTSKTQIAFGV